MNTSPQNPNPNPKEEGGNSRTRWPPYTPQEITILQELTTDTRYLDRLWNPIYDQRDITALQRFVETWRLRRQGATYPEISHHLGIDVGEVGMLITGKNYHPYLAQLYLNLQRLGPPKPGWKWLLETTPKPTKPYPKALEVPEQITCPHDILDFLQQFPPIPNDDPLLQSFGLTSEWIEIHKPELFTFNLGFLTGDAGKYYPEYEYRARHYGKAAMTTNMANKPCNKRLLMFVSLCFQTIGIKSHQINSSNPALIRWNTEHTNLITWLIRVCLGLKRRERTQWNPVRMPWLFKCPRELIISYVQGVTESDGYVEKNGRYAEICSTQNSIFYQRLLRKIGFDSKLYPRIRPSRVRLDIASAVNVPILNPMIRSDRFELLLNAARKRGIPPPSLSFFLRIGYYNEAVIRWSKGWK